MARKTITSTKNYSLFELSAENRIINIRKHKNLVESMKLYGFIPEFPVVCKRIAGSLVVVDGQHRLAIAKSLGLPVAYVVTDIDFDIAKVNTTALTWKPIDYAMKYAEAGHKHYQEGVEFCEDNKIPIGLGFALLAGHSTFTNIKNAFENGKFTVKDRAYADSVVAVYVPMTMLSPELRKTSFLTACMCICRVSGFDRNRLLEGAKRCRDKLVNLSTRDAFLEMLEEVYNFGRKTHFGLKAAAKNAMKARNATVASARKKSEKTEPVLA